MEFLKNSRHTEINFIEEVLSTMTFVCFRYICTLLILYKLVNYFDVLTLKSFYKGKKKVRSIILR